MRPAVGDVRDGPPSDGRSNVFVCVAAVRRRSCRCALLRFYGPMFFAWTLASFRAAQRSGRLSSGVSTGLGVAFATFCVFDGLNLLRVNLFLNDLTGRADWQKMIWPFRASGLDSLRLFVDIDDIKGAPLRIGVASVIGAVVGASVDVWVD